MILKSPLIDFNFPFERVLLIIVVASIVFFSCNPKLSQGQSGVNQSISMSDCGCDSLWTKSVSKEFVAILEQTTGSNHEVWKDYNFGDGVFVLNAGQVNDSTHCLGIWKKGVAISYKCSRDVPKMLTPLYSYYLNYNSTQEIDSALFGTFKHAPDFTSWMMQNDIEVAVYMPTDFPKFPFKIPALMKTQLAVHEAFHVEVSLRKWYAGEGFWPEWDKQPDRGGVESCYTKNEVVQQLIKKEQETLSKMIELLLEKQPSEAIIYGNKFVEIREERYASLEDIQIKLANGEWGNCRTTEAIMEIEEGLADYASWVKMFDIGVASQADLLKRYRANQKAMYYLTGCMLFHAAVLMNNGNDMPIIEKMVNAGSLEEGSIYTLFKEQMENYATEYKR